MKSSRFDLFVGTLAILCCTKWTAGQLNCLLSLPTYMVVWEDSPQGLQVRWELSKVCHDSSTCYGQGFSPGDWTPLHQLRPVLTQPRVSITFASSIEDLVFYRTDEHGFTECDFSSPSSTVVSSTPTLQTGRNYFIANSSRITWATCMAGLRLNVSVLEQRCRSEGTTKNFCSSSGRCVAQPGEAVYRCACCQSHYGEFCEKVDGCYANGLACLNGGTCVDGPDLSPDTSSFTCKCMPGYLGRYCNTRNTELCPRNECSNGGECQVDGRSDRGFTCTCPPGFLGDFCEVDVDDCLASDCLNNSTCVDGANSYTCTCQQGFSGVHCERDDRPCRSGVCFNGATCIEEDGRAKCQCAIGFTGINCMSEVLTCQTNPCTEHSVDCVTTSDNTFTCVCKPGFAGQKCDVNIDECASNPCGRGTCHDGVAGYLCRCPDGTNGSTCFEPAAKARLEASTNSSSSSSSSDSSGSSGSSSMSSLNVAVCVFAFVVLLSMMAVLVFFFIKYGVLARSGGRRKVYAIEIRETSSRKGRMNTSSSSSSSFPSSSSSSSSTREFFGDDEYPEIKTCLGSGLSPPFPFRRTNRKTEKF